MAKKAYRVRNWHHYNRSLVNRGSITYWISESVFKREGTITRGRGRPKSYSDALIEMGLVFRQLFRLTLRATEGFIRSLFSLMKANAVAPDYTTLSRRSKNLKPILHARPSEEGLHVLVDSTGVQIIGEGEWKTLRHGSSRHQLWRKLHIAMDANSLDILSMKMTDSVRLDGNHLPDLIDQIPGEIKQITGDGAYDKKSCYQAAYKRGAKPVFPPQHNATPQRNRYKKDPSLIARDQAIRQIGRGQTRDERLKNWKLDNKYHRRSLVETTMSRLKSIFTDQLRSRCPTRQRTDLALRCRILNHFNRLGLPISFPA